MSASPIFKRSAPIRPSRSRLRRRWWPALIDRNLLAKARSWCDVVIERACCVRGCRLFSHRPRLAGRSCPLSNNYIQRLPGRPHRHGFSRPTSVASRCCCAPGSIGRVGTCCRGLPSSVTASRHDVWTVPKVVGVSRTVTNVPRASLLDHTKRHKSSGRT